MSPVFIWPTPNSEDLLFWVEKSGDIPNGGSPVYGTPYPDTKKYPNHKLVYVSPQNPDTGSTFAKWYYASDRILQDEYNFTFVDADIEGTKFKGVERSYLIPRADFSPTTPAMGASMPNIPAGQFGTGTGTPSVITDYVLAARKQLKSPEQELDSIYVFEVRMYVKRCSLYKNDFDEALSGNLQTKQTLFYHGESVSGSGVAQVEKLTVGGSITVGVAASRALTLAARPAVNDTVTINAIIYRFVDTIATEYDVRRGASATTALAALRTKINGGYSGGTMSSGGVYTHGATGTAGNSIAISSSLTAGGDGWVGGATTLTGGVSSTAADVTVTFTAVGFNSGTPVTVTVPTYDGDTTATVAARIAVYLGDSALIYAFALPSASGSVVSLTYRTKAANSTSDEITSSMGSTGLTGTSSSTAATLPTDTVETVFADRASPYWGLQGDFTEREGVQLSEAWYAVTTKQVVPSSFVANGRSYATTMDFLWPAVLSNIQIDVWERTAGGTDMLATPYYSKEQYRGPCNATVTQKFFINPPSVQKPQVMLPLPIDVQTPIFGVNVGPTLHPARTITLSTGTDHPVYELTFGVWYFPPTTPTDWPASIIASDEVVPYRGGYMKTTVVVYPPSYS